MLSVGRLVSEARLDPSLVRNLVEEGVLDGIKVEFLVKTHLVVASNLLLAYIYFLEPSESTHVNFEYDAPSPLFNEILSRYLVDVL
jgi:hypothetical protein